MMRYYYFPGCSMASTGQGYQKSINAVARKIGLQLLEIPDWNCCGATAAHTMNELMALALPARNLAQAEADGENIPIAIACAACYSRMRYAQKAVASDPGRRAQIEGILEKKCAGENEILSFLDVFSDLEVMAAVQGRLNRNLKGLRVACYYGCLTTRPREVTGCCDRENPMELDNIIALTGATPVDWAYKTECCGASHQVDAPAESRPLLDRILRNAQESGADCIVTACPLCALNLDMRQKDVNGRFQRDYDLPVYQFTELLALCMGVHPREFGLHTHFVPAVQLMKNALKKEGDGQ